MRYLFGILVLYLLLQAPDSAACLPSMEAFSGVDNYRRYEKSKSGFDISANDSFVTLVKTKKIKTRNASSPNEGYENFSNAEAFKLNNPPNKVYEFKLEVIENLKGRYSPKESFIVPAMTKKETDEESMYLAQKRTFDFWDGLDLSASTSSWYGISSCGEPGSKTLLKNQYYLVFGTKNEPEYFEPINSLDDPLLIEFRNVVSDAPKHALKRTPENFFSHMTGYQTVEIQTCPFGELNFDYNYAVVNKVEVDLWKPSSDTKKVFQNSIKKSDAFNSQFPISLQNFLSNVTCQPGAKFFVIERLFEPARPAIGFVVPEPKHRFLRIENGNIDTRDLPSRITIKAPYVIPVEQVKTWIKEGGAVTATNE